MVFSIPMGRRRRMWDVPSMTYRIMPMPSLLPRGLKCVEDKLG